MRKNVIVIITMSLLVGCMLAPSIGSAQTSPKRIKEIPIPGQTVVTSTQIINDRTEGSPEIYKSKQQLKESISELEQQINREGIKNGGIYFDSGNIIVQLVDSDSNIQASVKKFSKFPDAVKFKSVEFSKEELEAAKSKLSNSVKINRIDNIKGWTTDIPNNKLVVFANDLTDRVIVEKYIDSNMFDIQKFDFVTDQFNPGSSIYDDVGGTCAAAFFGVDSNSNDVLVTAGHCNQGGATGPWYYPSKSTSNKIGNFSSRTSGNTDADAGYISLTSSSFISVNEARTGVPIGQVDWSGNEATGDQIYVSGRSNTLGGTVQYNDVSLNLGGQGGYGTIDHLRLTSASGTISGDSGSLVYKFVWNSSKNRWEDKVEGIHKGVANGTDSNGNPVTYEVYSSATWGVNDLGMSAVYIAQ